MIAPHDLTPDGFQKITGVSRETLDRLKVYAERLETWQRRLNLVGPKTIPILWQRHMLDSAQIFPLITAPSPSLSPCRVLVDLGSGAGFPGLVLAAMGIPEVHLVESDTRKCVFLREAARAMDIKVTVHTQRIEAVDPFPADVITARALASLAVLVDMSQRFTHKGSMLVFPKGQDMARELAEAKESWTAQGWTPTVRTAPSITDPAAGLIMMSGLPVRDHSVGQSVGR